MSTPGHIFVLILTIVLLDAEDYPSLCPPMMGLTPWLVLELHQELVLKIAICQMSERTRPLPHNGKPLTSQFMGAPSRSPITLSHRADVLETTVT